MKRRPPKVLLVIAFIVAVAGYFIVQNVDSSNQISQAINPTENVNKNEKILNIKTIPVVEGTIGLVHYDSFNLKTSQEKYYITANSNQYDISEEQVIKAGGLEALSGKKLKVNNAKVDSKNTIITSDSISVIGPVNQEVSPHPTLPPINTAGPINKKVAVILFNFPDNQTQTYSPAQAKQYVFTNPSTVVDSVNGYFKEVSYSKLELVGHLDYTGDVFGWYTITSPSSPCISLLNQNSVWGQEAKNLASVNGYNQLNYDYTVFVFPQPNGCSWGGAAFSINKEAFANTGSPGTIIHEIAHLLDQPWLSHANGFNCYDQSGNRVAYSNNCQNVEYGDPFDVMGGGWRHFNAFYKNILGFLSANNIQTITTPGNYNIYPLEVVGNNVKTLKVPAQYDDLGNLISSWYLEFRRPYGVWDNFSVTDPVVNGVLLRKAVGSKSFLIDTHAQTSDFLDAPLSVGETFTETNTGFSVTLNQIVSNVLTKGGGSSLYAKVYVNPGIPCTNMINSSNSDISFSISNSPITTGNFALLQLPISIPFTVSNNNIGGCPPIPFLPVQSAKVGGYAINSSRVSMSPSQINLTSGQTVNGTININLSGLLPCSILPFNNYLKLYEDPSPISIQDLIATIPITINYQPSTATGFPPLGSCY